MASYKHESLLKYKNPNLVSTQQNTQQRTRPKPGQSESKRTKEENQQDYLNSILPPHQYMEDGQLWIKYVSPQPAT